jgi:acyl-CoA synthetase (AMP-forming)/AMP-acid ligase II
MLGQIMKTPLTSQEDLIDLPRHKVPSWWLPDDVLFVDELRHKATGKVLKTKLWEDFRSHKLPSD